MWPPTDPEFDALLDINIQYQLEVPVDKNVYFSELQNHISDLPVRPLLYLQPHLNSEYNFKYKNICKNVCGGF